MKRWVRILLTVHLVLATAFVVYKLVRSKPAPDPEVSAFIREYFDLWSQHDLKAYTETFAPNARITFNEAGNLIPIPLKDFFEFQREAFERHPDAKELPLNIEVERMGDQAHCQANWVLTHSTVIKSGTDRFQLEKQAGKWKITALEIENVTAPKSNSP